jgi:hypothetical protein
MRDEAEQILDEQSPRPLPPDLNDRSATTVPGGRLKANVSLSHSYRNPRKNSAVRVTGLGQRARIRVASRPCDDLGHLISRTSLAGRASASIGLPCSHRGGLPCQTALCSSPAPTCDRNRGGNTRYVNRIVAWDLQERRRRCAAVGKRRREGHLFPTGYSAPKNVRSSRHPGCHSEHRATNPIQFQLFVTRRYERTCGSSRARGSSNRPSLTPSRASHFSTICASTNCNVSGVNNRHRHVARIAEHRLNVLDELLGHAHEIERGRASDDASVLALVNSRGARAAGGLSIVTVLIKILPLFAVIVAAALRTASSTATGLLSGMPLRISGLGSAVALTLYALTGFENATAPVNKVRDPSRTIPLALVGGTLFIVLLFVLSSTSVTLLLREPEITASTSPFADAIAHQWGSSAGFLAIACIAVAAFGGLNGMLLATGELGAIRWRCAAISLACSRGRKVRTLPLRRSGLAQFWRFS